MRPEADSTCRPSTIAEPSNTGEWPSSPKVSNAVTTPPKMATQDVTHAHLNQRVINLAELAAEHLDRFTTD